MTTITGQIWLMTGAYSLGWGIYLAFTVKDYLQSLRAEDRRRGAQVANLRYMIVAICLFMFPFSFFVRTSLVLIGLQNANLGILTFFAIAGMNALGIIVAIATKVRPEWFE